MSKHARQKSITKPVSIASAIGVLALAATNSVAAVTVNVDGEALTFNSAKVNGTGSTITQPDEDESSQYDIGVNLEPNEFVDYYDVITLDGEQIDARVTYLGGVDMEDNNEVPGNLEYIDEADEDPGVNDYLKIQLDFENGEGDSYADFKLEFFTNLSSTPEVASLQNLKMSTYDLDAYQYTELNNFKSYSVSTNTTLDIREARAGYTRFLDTSGVGYDSPESETKGRATVNFDEVSEMIFRVGKIEPEGSDTGSATFYLDFSVGQSWSGLEAEAVIAPSALPKDYLGPLPRMIDNCVPSLGGAATLTGDRLQGISTASVGNQSLTITSRGETELTMDVPAMDPGTYDVTYTSSAGKLTHLSSLKVCETETKTKFYVYERFANYRGDRGAVVASDRRAIEAFIDRNPGLTRVTCVGSTSGVPALATDPALAKARAANACSIVEELIPGVVTREAFVTGRGIGQFHRAVILHGVGSR